MNDKFAVFNHVNLKVYKFQDKEQLTIAINTIRTNSDKGGFTALRFYEKLNKWVAFETWE